MFYLFFFVAFFRLLYTPSFSFVIFTLKFCTVFYIVIVINSHKCFSTEYDIYNPRSIRPNSVGVAEYTACLQRSKTPHRMSCKHFNRKTQVMLELQGIWSTPSLLSLPGPLWPGVIAPDRPLSMSQIEHTQSSWLGPQNIPTASLQRGKNPPSSVLDMTLNTLMVRL